MQIFNELFNKKRKLPLLESFHKQPFVYEYFITERRLVALLIYILTYV